MIVLGLLAAIVYATFLGQRTKAKDAQAKDHVALVAVDVESCFTETDSYADCTAPPKLAESVPFDSGAAVSASCDTEPPVPTTPGKGLVAVIAAAEDCYVIAAQTDDGHFFWRWHRGSAGPEYLCTPAGQGGCVDGGVDPLIGVWSRS